MGKLMNNYFYGKAGKADYTPDDLPTTRFQLFWEMLRIRFASLCKLNLLYMLIWLPTMIVLMQGVMSIVTIANYTDDEKAGTEATVQVDDNTTTTYTYYSTADATTQTSGILTWTLILLIPCIGITGPLTAGACYVTRNWSRDEHSFMFSDFKDAVKSNWKQSLCVSLLTGAMPYVVYMCWQFYGSYSATNLVMMVPQILVLMIGIMWSISVTYMHPLIVGYQLRMRDVFRNALLLGVARLPMSVGIRLLHCVPVVLGVVATLMFGSYLPILILFGYYMIIGFGLSRFVTASYVNGVFDRYINSRIEGAEVGRGLAREDDDDEGEAGEKQESGETQKPEN